MGSRPSTDDMLRWSLELGLYLRKELNRFKLANKLDKFEEVLMESLPSEPALNNNQENSIRLERLSSREDQRRLSGFLSRLVDRCENDEDHNAMQRLLRETLLKSRRVSVLQSCHNSNTNNNSNHEPMCFFCASDLPSTHEAHNTLLAGHNPLADACGVGPTSIGHPPFFNQQVPLDQEPIEVNPIYQLKFIESQPPPTPPASHCAPTPEVPGVTNNNCNNANQQPEPSTTPPEPPLSPVQLEPVNLSGDAQQASSCNIAPQASAFAPQPGSTILISTSQLVASSSNAGPVRRIRPMSQSANASQQPPRGASLARMRSPSPDLSERSLHIVENHCRYSSGSSASPRRRRREQPAREDADDKEDDDDDDETHINNHEDSMQHWFEGLNSKNASELPRASTPLKADDKLDRKEDDKCQAVKRKKLCLGLAVINEPLDCKQPANQTEPQVPAAAAEPQASQQPLNYSQPPLSTATTLKPGPAPSPARMAASQRPAPTVVTKPRTKRTKKRPSAGHSSSKQFSKQQ